MDDELGLAMICPFPGEAITVNSVQFLHMSFNSTINKDWCEGNESFDVQFRKEFFIGRTIFKVGAMSGLTTTVITDVNEDDILVSQMFSAAGDSGSIVFTEVDGIYFIDGIIAGNDDKANKDNDDDTECYDMENFHDELYDTANTRLSDTVRIKGVWAFHTVLMDGMMG